MLDDPIRKLSLNTLRIVADVLRMRSLTRVAQLYGVSQPAVSLHIRKFEDATGLQVVRRVGNELLPSVHSEQILSACQGVLRSISQLDDYSRSRADRRKRVGVDHELFARLERSTQDLPQFIEKYFLVVDSSDRLIKRFAEAHVDAVVRPLYTLEERPELTFEVPFCWIGEAAALSAFGADAKVPVIMPPKETPYGSLARTYLARQVESHDIVAETGDRAMLRRFLERGVGYAYLPEFAASAYYDGVAASDLPPVLRRRGEGSFGIFYHKNDFSFPDAEALLGRFYNLVRGNQLLSA
ncbi:LysR family transcriptional regulator [Chelativorans sp. YIM 93263]|uniref:LysR family transcriptional regulator n=1 Tax=Chelativorans sp. YIM 93263 TaxID=2906648 RepID=UPI002378C2E0|nr:LysR family transcriptional regulator [Chelativorans sp. YIM 93263]